MIEIITEKVDMPDLDERRYQKLPNRNGKDIWCVFDMETGKETLSGSYENASLACHNLNKKYYRVSDSRAGSMDSSCQKRNGSVKA